MQNPPHDAKVLPGHCYAFAKVSRMVFRILLEPMKLDMIIWSLDMVTLAKLGRNFPGI